MAERHQCPGFWKLWSNPIFHRYRRSQLRLGRLIPVAICTLILTAFVFLLPYTVIYYQADRGNATLAARVAFFPVLAIQGLILMLKGTFSVASGITREYSEGILDYQRLTPISPLTKIVGYLFGLPIREYLLFFLTLPFTFYAIEVGDILFLGVAKLYLVFFTAVLLYHLTGFFAGTVVKRKVLAGVLSQAMILFIYWILPNLSVLGYMVFDYLTLYPVLSGLILDLFPESPDYLPWLRSGTADVFDWNISPVLFSIVVQLSVAFLFLIVIHRKWCNPSQHLLGKNTALLTYGILVTVLLGTMMPVIKSGMIFISKATNHPMVQVFGEVALAEQALFATFLFGLILSMLALLMSVIITPTKETFRKGVQRIKKLQRRFQPVNADSTTGLGYSLLIIMIGAAIWCLFTNAIHQSEWISRFNPISDYGIWMVAAFMVPILVCLVMLEQFSKRGFFLWMLFIWLLPLFAAIILYIINPERFSEIAIFCGSLSGIGLLFYSGCESYLLPEDYSEYVEVISLALKIGLAIQLALLIALSIRLLIQKRAIINRLSA